MTHTYVDIRLTEERDIRVDESGDWETIEGEEAIIQDSAIDVFDVGDSMMGDTLTATQIERLRSRVGESLDENEYVESVYGLTVTNVKENGVEMEVFLDTDDSFHFVI